MRIDSCRKTILRAVIACSFAISILSCKSDLLSDPEGGSAGLAGDPTVTSRVSSLTIEFETETAATTKIEYGTSSGVYGSSVSGGIVASESHSLDLTGLAPETVHYFRIITYKGGSISFTSGEYSATTLSGPSAAQKARGIWLVGGLSGAAITTGIAEVDLYDPVTETWYPAVTSVPVPVSFAGYAAYDGRLFVIGGFGSTASLNGAVQQRVQIYDVSTDTWSEGATMTTARANIYASVLSGNIYVLGGTTGAASAAWANTVMNNYEYSVAANTWTTKNAYVAGTAYNSERFTYAMNNTLFSIGGRSSATALAAPVHEGFIPSTLAAPAGAVTGATEVVIPAVRTGLSGAAYDPLSGTGCVMLVGGIGTAALTGTTGCFINQGTTAATINNTVHYLQEPFAAPLAWQAATINYPINIAFASSTVSTAVAPRLYTFGGTSTMATATPPSGQSVGYWANVPAPPAGWTPTWTSITMPRGRWGHGAVTLNQ